MLFEVTLCSLTAVRSFFGFSFRHFKVRIVWVYAFDERRFGWPWKEMGLSFICWKVYPKILSLFSRKSFLFSFYGSYFILPIDNDTFLGIPFVYSFLFSNLFLRSLTTSYSLSMKYAESMPMSKESMGLPESCKLWDCFIEDFPSLFIWNLAFSSIFVVFFASSSDSSSLLRLISIFLIYLLTSFRKRLPLRLLSSLKI